MPNTKKYAETHLNNLIGELKKLPERDKGRGVLFKKIISFCKKEKLEFDAKHFIWENGYHLIKQMSDEYIAGYIGQLYAIIYSDGRIELKTPEPNKLTK